MVQPRPSTGLLGEVQIKSQNHGLAASEAVVTQLMLHAATQAYLRSNLHRDARACDWRLPHRLRGSRRGGPGHVIVVGIRSANCRMHYCSGERCEARATACSLDRSVTRECCYSTRFLRAHPYWNRECLDRSLGQTSMLTGSNDRSQRTPRSRCACILRKWRGAVAAER